MNRRPRPVLRPPTPAYVAASWAALAVGMLAYLAGLWRADMQLNEKGFYLMSYTLSLFAVVTVQKNTRDLAAAPRFADDDD